MHRCECKSKACGEELLPPPTNASLHDALYKTEEEAVVAAAPPSRDVGVVQAQKTRFKFEALLFFSQSNFETGALSTGRFQARISLHRPTATWRHTARVGPPPKKSGWV